jgi:hypothetical protein
MVIQKWLRLNVYSLKIMRINVCKALLTLAVVTSCSVALAPKPATAQVTLPTIVVRGTRPQSQTFIQNFLDGLNKPSLADRFKHFMPDFLVDPPELVPEYTTAIYYFNGCGASQQARTDVVTGEVSSRANNSARNSPSGSSGYREGSVFRALYTDRSSELFVVTSVTSGSVVITPVQGSFSGCN